MQTVKKHNISIELQNPFGFKSLPELVDIQTWSDSSLIDKKEQTLSLVLRVVDSEESAELNLRYRQKKGPTNILSFAYDLPDFMAEMSELTDQNHHLGDLVVCEPIVRKEAIEQDKILQHHWAHLIIHGVLHLQGYDHIDAAEALAMETLEIQIMEQLGFNNPY